MSKILHVIPTLSLKGGGGDRACYELARAQAKNGDKVKILTFVSEDDFENAQDDNFKIIRCNKSSNPIFNFLGSSAKFKTLLKQYVLDSDLVHIHTMWRLTNYYAFKICVKYNVEYIIQPHGSLEPWRLNYKKLRKKIWYNLFEVDAFRNALFLVAESENDKSNIIAKINNNKTVILPCGSDILNNEISESVEIEFEKKKYKIDDNKKVILFLGRIDVHKGVDILVRSISNLKEDLDDYILLIVGPDYSGTKAKIESLIVRLNITDKVLFTQPVYEIKDKINLFKMSEFFVLPSYSENFGITVIEALACKTPVVVSSETAWFNLEKKGMALVTKPNETDLTNKIKQMLSMTDEEKRQMTISGFNYAKNNFSWEQIAIKLNEFVVSYKNYKI